MRVYIPVLLSTLRQAIAAGELVPRGGLVFAVTTDLRLEYPEADDEELEYLAMADAARACLRLLAAASHTEAPLRVVVAADVPAFEPASDRDRAAATVDGAVPWRQIASVHLDGREAAEAVRAAAAVVDEADLGDIDAEFAVGSAEDIDLAWYAPEEVSYLLAELDDDERPAGQEP